MCRFLSIVVLVVAWPNLVCAFEVGDVVVVIQTAEIRSGGKVVGTVEVGNPLTIGSVGEEGLWVNFHPAGWIKPDEVIAAKDAEAHFNGKVAADADDADALYGRGRARMAHDKWDAAIADFTAAAKLAPERASIYLVRAHAQTRRHRYEDALADYAEAVKRDPLNAQIYRLRAGVHVEKRDYAAALADYNLAARLFPNDAALNNDRAWFMATCPDEKYRNGDQAVADATKACEASAWQVFNRLGTLAAAYAELGDFAKAVEFQRKCLELAPARYQQAQQSRLKLFQAGKPYREVAGSWK